jgi:hypothetical protein
LEGNGEIKSPVMKSSYFFFALLIALMLVTECTTPGLPYEVLNDYMFVQQEVRRNDSTAWELVWEDDFDRNALDTTHWSKIGLYTSERLLEKTEILTTSGRFWLTI